MRGNSRETYAQKMVNRGCEGAAQAFNAKYIGRIQHNQEYRKYMPASMPIFLRLGLKSLNLG